MALPQTWPALLATARGAVWLTADGEIEKLAGPEAALRAAGVFPLVVHGPATAARLGLDSLAARDLLELYAFVRPATFCLPTVRGLCEALDLACDDELAALPRIATALLAELDDMAALASPDLKDTALTMARGDWPWGAEVLAALGIGEPAKKPRPAAGLDVWRLLPNWEEPPPATPPGSEPVEPREARLRLAQLVSAGPHLAQSPPTPGHYPPAASHACARRQREDQPKVLLARSATRPRQTP